MPIKEIWLKSFRNHDEINLKFCPNINVIWGKNGSGKTAILEAIHSLSIGRSFRTNRKKELLKDDREFFSITGVFGHLKDKQIIQINQTKDGSRRIFVDENKLENVRDLIGLNPVVLLSPEEQIITKGSPQDKRNYFNKLFSVISSEYLIHLSDYNKIIKQRNKLLDDFHITYKADVELSVWNERLVDIGLKLWNIRKRYFDNYFNILNKLVEKFDGADFSLAGELIDKIPENEKAYIGNLEHYKIKDIYLGRTTYGPHTNKINFIFNEKNIKQFGSQGEHKLTLLLIKLAEVQLIREKSKTAPIILLDDLFAKLDDSRSKQALKMMDSNLQTIITTTDLRIVEKRGIPMDNKNNCSFYLE
jgi:DNA replication and repair protein RecF